MTSILVLGLLMGMRHAIESDHVAAVASMAAAGSGKRQAVRLGALWGGGHALALFAVGGVFIAFDWGQTDIFSGWLELAVGIMLAGLGVDLIRRVVVERIHFHAHNHKRGPDGEVRHFHAHAHAPAHGPAVAHDPIKHPHRHAQGLSLRAFLVGMVHGVAGSAALVVLVLGTIESVWLGIGYMALFGAGSIVGMALLSLTISVPLSLSARFMTWGYNGLQVGIGVWTLGLGASIVAERVMPLIG